MNANLRRVTLNLITVVKAGILSLLALVLFGCPAKPPAVDASLQGRVVIKGSNTFGEELGPKLIAEYRKSRPNVTVELESKGSASGFAALIAGDCEVASSSRNPTAEEVAQGKAKGIEFNEYVIGYYGVAVIVNRSNPLTALSPAQVKSVFTGEVRNWKDLGGADLPIRIFIRDAVAGTNLGFRELAMDNQAYSTDAKTFTSYAALSEAVAQAPSAVGYTGMHHGNAAGFKEVSIGKTAPSAMSVNEGWYPYCRTLRLYTNQRAESAVARDFVLFVQREPGQKVLDDFGFVRRFEKKLNSLTPE